jgi:hypothetical protein
VAYHSGYASRRSTNFVTDLPDDLPNKLIVYPNPAQDRLVVDIDTPADVVVYNSLGKVVLQERLSGRGELSTSVWPAGMYMLLVPGYQPMKIEIRR